MKMTKLFAVLSLLWAVVCCSTVNPIDKYKYPQWPELPESEDPAEGESTVVEIRDNKLYVNGNLFFVKGAACNGLNVDSDGENPFWNEAVAAGANSVRIYSPGDLPSDINAAKACLDRLVEAGVYVCFGLEVKRECDGFDYTSEPKREVQTERLKAEVDKFKGHPAILFWCIGNEVDASTKTDGSTFIPNVNVWKDINTIARYIAENDGRPTSTAVTGIWNNQPTADNIKEYCPELDLLCVNNYEGNIQDLYASWSAKNMGIPYLVSEFGIRGTWDNATPRTSFGTLIEPTSNEKAETYKNIYNNYIQAHSEDGCLGSYVFLWGWQTHGDVLTWYTMFDQFYNAALPAVDAMSKLWSGEAPSNSAPCIAGRGDLTIDGKSASFNVSLTASSTAHTASVKATDPDGDPLSYDWRIIKDERLPYGNKMSGGIGGLFEGQTNRNTVTFKAPSEAGAYRLIVYVRDQAHKKASSAVLPFEVK